MGRGGPARARRGGRWASDRLRRGSLGLQPDVPRHERSTAPRGPGDTLRGNGGFEQMMERPTGAAHEGVPAATASGPDTDLARRAQLLSTEHWSLLATRSMSWNEAFSRTGMFLSTLSAATVALALA